jgi:hypothetical protein
MHYTKPLRRHHVKSTAVRTMGYDADEWVLQLEYTNGKVYNYFRVPPGEFELLEDAPSIGDYVNRQIKPFYEYEELESAHA